MLRERQISDSSGSHSTQPSGFAGSEKNTNRMMLHTHTHTPASIGGSGAVNFSVNFPSSDFFPSPLTSTLQRLPNSLNPAREDRVPRYRNNEKKVKVSR